MKQEFLEIAKQYKEDCNKIEKRARNFYHYLLFKYDGTIEYRKTSPYVITNVETLVIINEYGCNAIAYTTGNYYIAYSAQSLCISDEGDSESMIIAGWTIKFSGMYFIWDEGDWPKMELQKNGLKYVLLFRSYEAIAKNWDIVTLFMIAEDQDHLECLLKPYFEERKIIKNGYYKIRLS